MSSDLPRKNPWGRFARSEFTYSDGSVESDMRRPSGILNPFRSQNQSSAAESARWGRRSWPSTIRGAASG